MDSSTPTSPDREGALPTVFVARTQAETLCRMLPLTDEQTAQVSGGGLLDSLKFRLCQVIRPKPKFPPPPVICMPKFPTHPSCYVERDTKVVVTLPAFKG